MTPEERKDAGANAAGIHAGAAGTGNAAGAGAAAGTGDAGAGDAAGAGAAGAEQNVSRETFTKSGASQRVASYAVGAGSAGVGDADDVAGADGIGVGMHDAEAPSVNVSRETLGVHGGKMHVVRAFTLRTLAKNRVRTAVTVAGIALSAALLTAVLVSLSSLTAFLYDEEVAQQGAWQVSATTNDSAKVAKARKSDRVAALSVVTDVGFAVPGSKSGASGAGGDNGASASGEEEPANDTNRYGNYLAVRAIDDDFSSVCALPLSEGRYPENSHEIVLYSLYRNSTVFSSQPCDIGGTVTLNLGVRKPVPATAKDAEATVSTANPSTTANVSRETSADAGSAGTGATASAGSDASATGAGSESADSQSDNVSRETSADAGTASAVDASATGAGVGEMPAYLDISYGYLDAEADGGSFNEEFVDAGLSQTYTVVGFYQTNNSFTATGFGTVGFTFADDQMETALGKLGEAPSEVVYFTTSGFSTVEEIEEFACGIFDSSQDKVSLHNALLRYSGISSDRAIWDTLRQMVAVLAVIIVAASASLIYNSFAISVAQRTRQFGLLASIGASRRQIRAMVRYEAFVLALVGIPLGLALGVGGSYVVLTALSPALSKVMGGSGLTQFGVHVDILFLSVAAALAFVAVAVSAQIPSRRAARVSAVDALRNTQDVNMGRTLGKRRDTGFSGADPWKPHGIAAGARLFGVPVMLAQRSAKRSRSKGRVATASLLLAVILLVTAGALNLYLSTFVKVAGNVASYDVYLNVYGENLRSAIANDAAPGEDGGASGAEGGASGGFETADDLDSTGDRSSYPFGSRTSPSDFSAMCNALNALDGAEVVGSSVRLSVPVGIPASMVGEGLVFASVTETQEDGSVATQLTLSFIDDESYATYLAEQGLDAARFLDAEHPLALANRQAYGNDGSMYQIMDMIVDTGAVSLYAYGQRNGAAPLSSEMMLSSGRLGVCYEGSGETLVEVSREEGAHVAGKVEVGALVDDLPPIMKGNTVPVILMPASFAGMFGLGEIAAMNGTATTGGSGAGSEGDKSGAAANAVANAGAAGDTPNVTAADNGDAAALDNDDAAALDIDSSLSFAIAFEAEDHAAVAKSVQECMRQTGYDHYVYDATANQEQSELALTVVETFSLSFAIILALIAVTNVFNTLVNGLVLRRREFAMLKSVGMDDRAFNRMIAWECVRYGVRGLVGGLAVSVLVSFLLYNALGESVSGLSFVLPWKSMGAAVLAVVLVTLASTAYGLHRARANNIVEALRMQ